MPGALTPTATPAIDTSVDVQQNPTVPQGCPDNARDTTAKTPGLGVGTPVATENLGAKLGGGGVVAPSATQEQGVAPGGTDFATKLATPDVNVQTEAAVTQDSSNQPIVASRLGVGAPVGTKDLGAQLGGGNGGESAATRTRPGIPPGGTDLGDASIRAKLRAERPENRGDAKGIGIGSTVEAGKHNPDGSLIEEKTGPEASGDAMNKALDFLKENPAVVGLAVTALTYVMGGGVVKSAVLGFATHMLTKGLGGSDNKQEEGSGGTGKTKSLAFPLNPVLAAINPVQAAINAGTAKAIGG